MRSPHIDTTTIIDLYLTRHMTLKQVGKQVGMSHDGVAKRLIKAGIPRRSQVGKPR